MSLTFLGFNPGGFMAFGWCTLVVNNDKQRSELHSGTCSSADEALTAASATIQDKPSAIGIHAPLYWPLKAERQADQIVRGMVLSQGGPSGTVPAVHALAGAKLSQGIIVAAQSIKRWPNAPITEAHPGALLYTWPEASNFLSAYEFNNDHQRNAALCAYTAWSFSTRSHNQSHRRSTAWQDLRQLESSAYDPLPGPPAAYWFPAGSK